MDTSNSCACCAFFSFQALSIQSGSREISEIDIGIHLLQVQVLRHDPAKSKIVQTHTQLEAFGNYCKIFEVTAKHHSSFCMEPCNQSLCYISLFFCDPHPVVELCNHLDKAWQRKQHELRCGCFDVSHIPSSTAGLPKSPATPADPSVCPMIDFVAASTNGVSSIRPLPKVLFLSLKRNKQRQLSVWSQLHKHIGFALRCFLCNAHGLLQVETLTCIRTPCHVVRE